MQGALERREEPLERLEPLLEHSLEHSLELPLEHSLEQPLERPAWAWSALAVAVPGRWVGLLQPLERPTGAWSALAAVPGRSVGAPAAAEAPDLGLVGINGSCTWSVGGAPAAAGAAGDGISSQRATSLL